MHTTDSVSHTCSSSSSTARRQRARSGAARSHSAVLSALRVLENCSSRTAAASASSLTLASPAELPAGRVNNALNTVSSAFFWTQAWGGGGHRATQQGERTLSEFSANFDNQGCDPRTLLPHAPLIPQTTHATSSCRALPKNATDQHWPDIPGLDHSPSPSRLSRSCTPAFEVAVQRAESPSRYQLRQRHPLSR